MLDGDPNQAKILKVITDKKFVGKHFLRMDIGGPEVFGVPQNKEAFWFQYLV